ncbi:MAG: hypothetical protein SGJ05_05420 [bacterium]|nr:hypothetical protein [bacterium]
MLHRLSALVIIALVVMSCADKTTAPVEVTFSNTEFISGTFDGGTISQLTIASSGNETTGYVFFDLTATGSPGITKLSATVPNSGTGTYTLGPPPGIGILSVTIPGPASTLVTYSTTNGATGSITIEKIDVALMRVKGKFSGTVKASDGATKELVDGTFEAKW